MSFKKMRPSGGVIGGAHGLAAETVLATSEPGKYASGVTFVCPHKRQLFVLLSLRDIQFYVPVAHRSGCHAPVVSWALQIFSGCLNRNFAWGVLFWNRLPYCDTSVKVC